MAAVIAIATIDAAGIQIAAGTREMARGAMVAVDEIAIGIVIGIAIVAPSAGARARGIAIEIAGAIVMAIAMH